MKVLLTMFFFFAITIGLNAQQKNSIDLRITIASDLEVPKDVSLTLNYFDNSNPSINLLKITGKQLNFKKIEKEPVLAVLSIIWPNNKRMKAQFLLPVDTGTVTINTYNQIQVAFKNQQKLFDDFSLMEREVKRLQQTADAKIKTVGFENRNMNDVQREIDSLHHHYGRVIDHTIYKKNIDDHKNSFLGVLALTKYAERPTSHQRRKFQTDSLFAEYKSFTVEMQNLPTMQAFQKLLLAERQIEIGTLFPILTLKDTLNQAKDISKLYGSKYTLVDIWANWCAPCRDEHPNLLSQYEKYKQKGLEIISISIDKLTDTYLWKEAIKNDKIGLWPHFIDTAGQTSTDLKIRFIPANFLLDEKGKIVAKYLRGEDINKKLFELFKY